MRLSALGQVLMLLCMPLLLEACKTAQPGVRSTMFTQYTTIEAGTADATRAAQSVLNDLGLTEVESKFTNVDGWARGRTADNTPVKVSLERVDDHASNISVKIGTFGDTDLGRDIIVRIQKELGIETPPLESQAAKGADQTSKPTAGEPAKASE